MCKVEITEIALIIHK